MKKKALLSILAICATAISTFALTACNDNNNVSQTNTSQTNTSESAQSAATNEEDNLSTLEVVPTVNNQYATIIDELYDCITNKDDSYADEAGFGGVVEILHSLDSKDALKTIGYSYVDLNQNGVMDLMIVTNDGVEDGDQRILALYTTDNMGDAKLLAEGYVRNRFYKLIDGSIFNEGSSGAAYYLFGTYKVDDEKHELKVINHYFTDFENEGDEMPIWYTNEDGNFEKTASTKADFATVDEGIEFSMQIAEGKDKVDVTYLSDLIRDAE